LRRDLRFMLRRFVEARRGRIRRHAGVNPTRRSRHDPLPSLRGDALASTSHSLTPELSPAAGHRPGRPDGWPRPARKIDRPGGLATRTFLRYNTARQERS
jgi:hypothetical protein